jgi:hypothetical protein
MLLAKNFREKIEVWLIIWQVVMDVMMIKGGEMPLYTCWVCVGKNI